MATETRVNESDISGRRRRKRGLSFWTAFAIYNLAVHTLFLLFWAPALLLRDFRSRFISRLGLGVPRLKRSIIVHAASAGEALAIRKFVLLVRERFAGVPVVVTTVTTTGQTAAEKTGADYHLALPFDLVPSVRLFFARLNPVGLIIVEGDYWPNMLYFAFRRGVPVAVVNGRITEKAAARYRAARSLFKPLFESIAAYAVSDEEYVRRFTSTGVEPEKINVTGNLKYDCLDREPRPELVSQVYRRLDIDNRLDLLIAGSIHAGEEGIIARAYLAARGVRPTLKLLIAPRYPERSAAVVEGLGRLGIAAALYTGGGTGQALVVDTIGDLAHLYRAGACAVVGGSFIPRGGQNIVEAAYVGCAVIYGPYMDNFPYEVRLLEGNGGTIVSGGEDLIETLKRFYREPEVLEREMAKARAAADGLRGGGARALDFLMKRWATENAAG